MKSTLAASVAFLALLAGCADYNDPQPGPLPSPNPSTAFPPPGDAGDKSDGDQDSSDMSIGFGEVGPASVGMSTDEALATGAFRTGNPAPVDGCPEPALLWKSEFRGVDVLTTDDGTIASLGVSGDGPKTAAGIGIGSTLGDLKDAYADLIGPEEAGFGQTGAYTTDGTAYIGFLFNEAVADVTDTSKVTFIETTAGKPDLMRSGC